MDRSIDRPEKPDCERTESHTWETRDSGFVRADRSRLSSRLPRTNQAKFKHLAREKRVRRGDVRFGIVSPDGTANGTSRRFAPFYSKLLCRRPLVTCGYPQRARARAHFHVHFNARALNAALKITGCLPEKRGCSSRNRLSAAN